MAEQEKKDVINKDVISEQDVGDVLETKQEMCDEEVEVMEMVEVNPSPGPEQEGKDAKEEEEKDTSSGEEQTLRKQLFLLFDDPMSSKWAMGVTIWILLLILMSTTTFCLESLPVNHDGGAVWDFMELFAIINFSVEYGVRIITAENRLKWARQLMNMVDLVAILPFYIELLLEGSGMDISGLAVIRVVRLTRVFRLFKLSKYSKGFTLVSKTLKQSGDATALLTFLIGLAMVFFSSAMYFAELSGTTTVEVDGELPTLMYKEDLCTVSCSNDCVSPFQSIPATFWWSIVTMTTVGYGDTFPLTVAGKFVGVFTMLSGILIIAFPITIIGANFADVWEANKRKGGREGAKEAVEKDAIQSLEEVGGEPSVDVVLAAAIAKNEELTKDIVEFDERLREAQKKQLALYKMILMMEKDVEEQDEEESMLNASTGDLSASGVDV